MIGGEWVCIGLLVLAAVAVLAMRRWPLDPPWPKWEACKACAVDRDSRRHPGNPAGQCHACWTRDPAIFPGERD
jgi:hypothetical protein